MPIPSKVMQIIRGVAVIMSALAVSAALSGCNSVAFRFDGKMYRDTPSLIAARQKVHAEIIANTKPVADPVGGRAALVLRTDEALSRMITEGLEKQGMDMSSEKGETIRKHFLATSEERSKLLLRQLQKSNLFDAVDLIRMADPSATDIGAYDYLIYFDKAESILQYWQIANRVGVHKRFEVDTQGSQDFRVRQSIWLRELTAAARSVAVKS